MLQLVNLSNHTCDLEIIQHSSECLQTFLDQHQLDGIEMMFGAPWDRNLHKMEWIQGVHLRFWFNWLAFWRGNQAELLRQFGNDTEIETCYGGLTRQAWLNEYRKNIRMAKQTGANYVVFHVSQVYKTEVFSGQFSVTDEEVIEATIEVVNELADEIPADMALLFENLWWPGMTLKNPEMVVKLLENVNHSNIGIMLDTGHLMNTNQDLRSEFEGIDYIIGILNSLGEYKKYVRGIHLQKSLSGEYMKLHRCKNKQTYAMSEIINHVFNIDQHQPFTTPEVQRLIEYVKPEFLVHEFMYSSMAEWSQKIRVQKAALGQGEI